MTFVRTVETDESVELPCLHDGTEQGLIMWPACLQVRTRGAGFSKAQEEAPAKMDPGVRNTGVLHHYLRIADHSCLYITAWMSRSCMHRQGLCQLCMTCCKHTCIRPLRSASIPGSRRLDNLRMANSKSAM